MTVNLLFVFSVIAVILSLLAIGLSGWALIECLASKRSTHQIQWQPVPDSDSMNEKELNAYFKKEMEDIDRDLL